MAALRSPEHDSPDGKRPQLIKNIQQSGPLLTSGLQMAVSVVLMGAFGWWLDGVWGTTPWLLVAGVMFGAAAGLYHFIRTVIEVSKDEEARKKEHR